MYRALIKRAEQPGPVLSSTSKRPFFFFLERVILGWGLFLMWPQPGLNAVKSVKQKRWAVHLWICLINLLLPLLWCSAPQQSGHRQAIRLVGECCSLFRHDKKFLPFFKLNIHRLQCVSVRGDIFSSSEGL